MELEATGRQKDILDHILTLLRQGVAQTLGEQFEALVLYGSQARQQATARSDIDVLIIVKSPFEYSDLVRQTSQLVASLSLEYDRVISRAFVSKERFEQEQSPFLCNVRREGVFI